MSATNACETAILTLYFLNTDHANIGDAAGLQNSVAAGSFYISLHTADPGEAGAQNTTETAYTGYARQAVARSGAGWVVTGNTADNAAAVNFPNCTAAPGAAVTFFGVGTDLSGAGNLLFSGALGASYQPSIGNAPFFAVGVLDIVAD